MQMLSQSTIALKLERGQMMPSVKAAEKVSDWWQQKRIDVRLLQPAAGWGDWRGCDC
jgi:hypothetical protein